MGERRTQKGTPPKSGIHKRIWAALLSAIHAVTEAANEFFQREDTEETIGKVKRFLAKAIFYLLFSIVSLLVAGSLVFLLFALLYKLYTLFEVPIKLLSLSAAIGFLIYFIYFHGKKDEPPPPPPDLKDTEKAYLQARGLQDYSRCQEVMVEIIRGISSQSNLASPIDQADIIHKPRIDVKNEACTIFYYEIEKQNPKLECNPIYIKKLGRSRIAKYTEVRKIRFQTVPWNGNQYVPITLLDVSQNDLKVRFDLCMTTPWVLSQLKGEELYELEVETANDGGGFLA